MKLLYRMHTKNDEEALVKLWCEHGGWDQIDLETWSNRFMKSPFGPAEIVLAIDQESDEIVGQFAFIPYPVLVNGCEVRALRPYAPIMSEKVRRFLGKGHPIVTMYFYGIEYFKAQNSLIYMLPDPRWWRVFRKFSFLESASFPLWSLSLPLKDCIPLKKYTASPLKAWDTEVDGLWQKASHTYHCSVVRDARVLVWKLSHGEYKILTIRKDEKLIGLVASKKWGDRQWLICDLLAMDGEEALWATITAVTNLANKESINADPASPIRKVAILATPIMEPVLKSIGFSRDNYDFPAVIHRLDSTLASEDIEPSRWYFSAND